MNPLAFLSPYKLLIEILVIGSIAAGAIWGVHSFLLHEQQIGYDRAQAEYTAKSLLAEQAARATETALRKQLEDAQNAATQREQVIRSTAAAATAASVSLRDTIATIRNGVPLATIDALRNATIALGNVFAECQDRRREVAESAERLNSDKQTLIQAWPRSK